MSLPTIEVVYRPGTEAFRAKPKDASFVKPAFDILSQQKGQLQKFFGLQHEDKTSAYVIVAWEDLEDHKRLMNDTETYPRLGAAVGSFFDVTAKAPQNMVHVRPTSDPFKAFEAPVTEIAYFTLKAGTSKDAGEQLIDTLSKAMIAAGSADGVVHSAWGPVVEKDNVIALFIGWTSVDAHHKAISANTTLAGLITQLRAAFEVDLVHVEFTAA
ncbi:uncharacterized protein TRAVEDRAFT_165861 [Trametes versicolor FP-101664 SS1]|uniref:uncharacterized protein n=1 Tax=Trametes versicolor (strain FP-101664) TaxID=717944 RepID=UPI0004623F75|nr:uncharacterized protein TRAVEDRAFT_165861 [Trametes versicolor FP-101664 SS1]EIW60784.1 hypothetical protein TRAVEDRAFT_165861 [Trametes versicolor FP-101664 SS1]